jgi:PQ loop repeat
LLITTIVSYIPQNRRLWSHWDTCGISLWYVVLNAIASTEQFAVLLNLFVTVAIGDNDVPSTVLGNPPLLGDWLNLAQLGAMWACSLGLYGSPSVPRKIRCKS